MKDNSNVSDLCIVRRLREEANELASEIGSNPYSNFVIKYGHRPSPGQTATMGRYMARRLRASDGTLQPRLSKSERQAINAAKELESNRHRKIEEIGRLCTALGCLNENKFEPADLVGEVGFVYQREIVEKLEKSLQWLNRFAEEWMNHDEQSDKIQKCVEKSY